MTAKIIAALRWAALFALLVAVALIIVRWRFPRQQRSPGFIAYWKDVLETMRDRARDRRERAANLRALRACSALVVDPDEKSARVLTWQLEGLGCRVTTARNGTDGIAAAMKSDPDIVIADALLPDISARDFHQSLPGTDKPVVFVGVLPDQYDSLRRLGRNVACFAKPYDPDEVISLAGYMLRRDRSTQGSR